MWFSPWFFVLFCFFGGWGCLLFCKLLVNNKVGSADPVHRNQSTSFFCSSPYRLCLVLCLQLYLIWICVLSSPAVSTSLIAHLCVYIVLSSPLSECLFPCLVCSLGFTSHSCLDFMLCFLVFSQHQFTGWLLLNPACFLCLHFCNITLCVLCLIYRPWHYWVQPLPFRSLCKMFILLNISNQNVELMLV